MVSLAPHERLPEILVVPREKTPTGAAARGCNIFPSFFDVDFLLLQNEMTLIIYTTYSRILAWKIPWTEEPGELQSMGSQELETTQQLHHHCYILYYIFYNVISCLKVLYLIFIQLTIPAFFELVITQNILFYISIFNFCSF